MPESFSTHMSGPTTQPPRMNESPQMTPTINEAVVRDRITRARERAEHRRVARAARAATMRRTGLRSLRDAVGHGLIAWGERLVDENSTPDPATLRKAA
jgi:hypothetical protein